MTGLVTFLDRLPELSADARAVPAGADAVAVTTWHGAKGLEWPVTVLFEVASAFPGSPLGVRVVSDRDAFDPGDPLADRWIRYWPNPYHPAQKKMPFHQRLAAHRATASVLASWESERLRLLYVGWTRARDRLILASRPGKLNSGILASLHHDGELLIQEPAEDDPPEGAIVWGGLAVDLIRRKAAPVSPRRGANETMSRRGASEMNHELSPPEPSQGYVAAGSRSHPAASLAPSSIDDVADVGEIVRLGQGLELTGRTNETSLGKAIHGFFAADGPGLAESERLRVAHGLIDRWAVAGSIRAEDVVASADNLYSWIESRWPGATSQAQH